MEQTPLRIETVHLPPDMAGKTKLEILAFMTDKIEYHRYMAEGWAVARRQVEEETIKVSFDAKSKI